MFPNVERAMSIEIQKFSEVSTSSIEEAFAGCMILTRRSIRRVTVAFFPLKINWRYVSNDPDIPPATVLE